MSVMTTKIMIVDDDKPLSEYFSTLLESNGYLTTVFNDSQAALNYCKSNLNDYSLVISDICMPHIQGNVLAREILNINPNMPIILCSGYCANISKQDLLDSGVKRFMDKPINSSILLKTIDELKLC